MAVVYLPTALLAAPVAAGRLVKVVSPSHLVETEQRGKALLVAQEAPAAARMLEEVEAVLALLVLTQARQRLEMAALGSSG